MEGSMAFPENGLEFDRKHIWHPYTSMVDPLPVYPVVSAQGVRLTLADGRELIDGMSSWWAAIHGYNCPELNQALCRQIESVSHVMFGGITHGPGVALAARLMELTPAPLETVFFSDSGSVAVEVAIKMAIQFWHAGGRPEKQRLLTIRSGYHGDTFGAMAVCDPVTGMHELFSGILPKHYFAAAPQCGFYIVARIQVDHLVSVHAFQIDSGIYVLEMEWIDGFDLLHILRRETLAIVHDAVSETRCANITERVITTGEVDCRLKPGMAVAILRECLVGIAALHRGGIIHCDLKPSNVMVKRTGQVKIIDIGSAYWVGRPPAGQPCTLEYAAPEILAGQRADTAVRPRQSGLYAHRNAVRITSVCRDAFRAIGAGKTEYS